MTGNDDTMPLGIRLAYAGAIAVPLVVGVFAMARSPTSLDEAPRPAARPDSDRDDEDEDDRREERPDHDDHRAQRTSASASASVRPSVDPPPVKMPSAEARAASDAFDHALNVNDLKGALTALAHLLDVDPNAPTDDRVRGRIVDLAMRIQLVIGTEPDRMFDLLVNHMGTTGIDILYQIVTTKGGSRAAALAEKLLASPEVRARGTDALRAAYDLRAAKTCEAKREVFGEVAEHGDGRSLGQLFLLNRRCGGRRRRVETACCLQGDAELTKTMDALDKRGVK